MWLYAVDILQFMAYKFVSRAIIYDNEDRLLLARRVSNSGHGQWALIGGKPEGDELPAVTIVREVLEETNLHFVPTLFKEELDTITDPGTSWKVSYFSGKTDGTLKLYDKEHSEARYFTPNELSNLDIAFGHRRILEEFLASLK